MNYNFYVITKTPDLFEEGNLYDEFGYGVGNDYENSYIVVGCPSSYCEYNPDYEIKIQAFEEGEIIICDDSGREVCYPGRKPSKWDVEYEIFDNLDNAVERARELL